MLLQNMVSSSCEERDVVIRNGWTQEEKGHPCTLHTPQYTTYVIYAFVSANEFKKIEYHFNNICVVTTDGEDLQENTNSILR